MFNLMELISGNNIQIFKEQVEMTEIEQYSYDFFPFSLLSFL